MPLKDQQGITLLELVFTLAIIACIAFFALQDNGYLRKKNELIMLKENINTALRFAKITALSHGEAVYLTAVNDNNWAFGMAMYSSKEKALIYQWHWKFPSWQINWQGFNGDKNLLIAANPQNSASNGQFILLHKFSKERLSLQVNRLGRLSDSEASSLYSAKS